MAKTKEEITVVVEIADGQLVGCRANKPGVKVIIADYDVPDDWNADDMAPSPLQVLESEPDNYFQKVEQPAFWDVDGVNAFVNSLPYHEEDAD